MSMQSQPSQEKNSPGGAASKIPRGGRATSQQDMSTHASVGRFKNDEVPSLYIKGSSAGFKTSGLEGQTMATQSNHGVLCKDMASLQQPTSGAGIVDLRNVGHGQQGKPNNSSKGKGTSR